jgi:hypothetical protein
VSKWRVGELRPSQAIHTFGIGALVDLPSISAILLGLDEWQAPGPREEVVEERVLALVRSYLGPQVERLAKPPLPSDSGRVSHPHDPENLKGIPAAPFPKWVRCTVCDLIAPLDFGVFSLKDGYWRYDKTRFVHDNCPKARRAPPVIPVRFIVACEHGHLDDFPWNDFVHGGKSDCASLLRLYEFGVSAEAADITVKCDTCGASKRMMEAFQSSSADVVGTCSGRHPQLGHEVTCSQKPRAMLAGASNLWFPVTVSALSLPPGKGGLSELVRERWPQLKAITSKDILAAFRHAGHLDDFAQWTDTELFQGIEAHRQADRSEAEEISAWTLKVEEWDVFSTPKDAPNSRDFSLVEALSPPGYDRVVERVVQVERLRAVQSLIGFTRIFSPGDYADISEIEESRRAPIARRPPSWVPASEVRGEGLFIQFRESALRTWELEGSTVAKEARFRDAHTRFRRSKRIENPSRHFPGVRYVLLHSFAHALIRQLAVACGYSAASIRERVYAAGPHEEDGPMAGVLLYTAAPDAEGTLGGLVALGEPSTLAAHFDNALADLELCASDPLCAEHRVGEDGSTLHGAACHACMFASETSCERGNKYLDRTLLVPTMGGDTKPFFSKGLS